MQIIGVDIETEWNLKERHGKYIFTNRHVDIETEWNLKEEAIKHKLVQEVVDIETEWNLKNIARGVHTIEVT